MKTLEDIFAQFMQALKDLAQWNFPLSELLTTYTRFLNEIENLKFSEAGFIVETSGKMFAKRVDSLFTDVTSQNNNLIDQQNEKKPTGSKERKRYSKKIYFDDFESLETECKNTNMNDDHTKKTFKLLTRQFIEVEKRLPEALKETMIDIHNEDIGKKDAVRCNQSISLCDLLNESGSQEEVSDISLNASSSNINISLTNEDDEDMEHDTGYDSMLHESNQNSENLGFNDGVPSDPPETLESISETTEPQIHKETKYVIGSNDSGNPVEDVGESVENSDTVSGAANPQKADETNLKSEKGESRSSDAKLEKKSTDAKARQSKRIKNENNTIESAEQKSWQPIPFDESLPDELPKKRQFKVPDPKEPLINKGMKKNQSEKRITDFMKELEPKILFPFISGTSPPYKLQELDELKKFIQMGFESIFELDTMKMLHPREYSPALSTNMDDVMLSLDEDNLDIPENNYTPPTTPEDFNRHDDNLGAIPVRKRKFDQSFEKKLNDSEKDIKRWHDSLKEKLAEEEKLSQLDRHECGTLILTSLAAKENDRRLLLSDIVATRIDESAIFFEAALHLTSTYNVAIEEFEGRQNLELILLNESRSRAADNFDLPSSSKKRRKER